MFKRCKINGLIKYFVTNYLGLTILFLSPSSQSIHQVHKIKIFKTLRFLKLCFYATYFVKPAIFFFNNSYPELKLIVF